MRKNKRFSYAIKRSRDLAWVILLKYSAPVSSKRGLEVGIAPSFGSNMFRFRSGNLDLIHCDGRALARRDFTGNFVMFPFPNRVRERKWHWRGKEYSLRGVVTPQGDFPLIHGLVRDRVWNFSKPKVESDRASVETYVEINPRSPYFDCYPFPSSLRLKYTLFENAVRIDYKVTNLGKSKMPFGFAFHPLFSTSISGAGSTLITLPARFVMEMERDSLPTGRLLKLSDIMYQMFDLKEPHSVRNLKLDHVYTGLPPQRYVTIDHAKQKVRIRLSASPDFTHCVLYTMQREKFICVEHQTCSTDAHNLDARGYKQESHLLTLGSGRSHKGFLVYRIENYTGNLSS